MDTPTGNKDSQIPVSACRLTMTNTFFSIYLKDNTNWAKSAVSSADKAAADANAAAWAAYYSQYQQQPQGPMTPTSGAPGTTQTNGQGTFCLHSTKLSHNIQCRPTVY